MNNLNLDDNRKWRRFLNSHISHHVRENIFKVRLRIVVCELGRNRNATTKFFHSAVSCLLEEFCASSLRFLTSIFYILHVSRSI